jgi:hypothetical protein
VPKKKKVVKVLSNEEFKPKVVRGFIAMSQALIMLGTEIDSLRQRVAKLEGKRKK